MSVIGNQDFSPRLEFLCRPNTVSIMKHRSRQIHSLIRAIPEIISRGVGRRHFFVLWGEGLFLTTCPRGGGVTCPGGQGVFDP